MRMSGVIRRALQGAGYLKIQRRDYTPEFALEAIEFWIRMRGADFYSNLF
jgi:hypothetical protein